MSMQAGSAAARELAELVLASPPYSVLHPAETGGALARALLAALDENERLEARLAEVEKDRDDADYSAKLWRDASELLRTRAEAAEAERDALLHDHNLTSKQWHQASARADAAERERDEFAEAMHKASLAVVRRRAATEEKRA